MDARKEYERLKLAHANSIRSLRRVEWPDQDYLLARLFGQGEDDAWKFVDYHNIMEDLDNIRFKMRYLEAEWLVD